MRKNLILALITFFIFILASSTAFAATTGDEHEPRVSVESLPFSYIEPQFGSIDLPPEGYLAYPYPDSPFEVAITVPANVYTGEPFSLSTGIVSTMTGPGDPNWGLWFFYQQIFVPTGVAGPAEWSERFTDYTDPANPVIKSGLVVPRTLDWFTQPSWYAAGVASVEHASGRLVVAPEMAGHRMGPWAWLRDSDSAAWSFSPMVIEEPGEYVFELFLTTAYYVDAFGRNEWFVTYEPIRFTVIAIENAIPADIDIDPETLNIKSKGNWVTAYIEIPGRNLADIDLSTVKLAGINAAAGKTSVSDRDRDGIPDLAVKFSRSELIDNLLGLGPTALEVTGTIGNDSFAGTDTILVI